MKTINELRDQLTGVFTDLRADKIEAKNAKEMANLAGKIIATANLELKYQIAKKGDLNIPFLSQDGK